MKSFIESSVDEDMIRTPNIIQIISDKKLTLYFVMKLKPDEYRIYQFHSKIIS